MKKHKQKADVRVDACIFVCVMMTISKCTQKADMRVHACMHVCVRVTGDGDVDYVYVNAQG